MSAPTPQPPQPPAKGGIKRFLHFAIIGGFGAVFNLGLLIALTELAHLRPLIASAITIEITTVTNYFLNRRITWGDRRTDSWSLIHYHYTTLGGMLVQWVCVALFVLFGYHYALGALTGIAAASGLNFLAHHHFTFSTKPELREARIRVALYCLSATILLAGSAVLAHDWDTFVFERTAQDFLERGQTPYEVAAAQPEYIYFGVSNPHQSLWYAYPPLPLLAMTFTYAPAVLLGGAAPWVGRILIKLPFVLATLGLAALGRRLVATDGNPEALARGRKVERLLLFNPFFLIVAAVWGQFEALVLVLLAASVLAMRNDRWALGGLAWGLATLTKLFPLYLGPLWLTYLVRRAGWKPAFTFFATAGATIAAVSLPFYLREPGGFLRQTVLMHADRPPGRFSPLAPVFEFVRFIGRNVSGLVPGDEALAAAFSLLSFLLTAFVLLTLTAASTTSPATERNLLLWSALSLLGGLLATKLVSEQYMLLPLGLLLIYRYHGGLAPAILGDRAVDRLATAITYGFLVAAILDSAHFVLFVPPDVAARIFDAPQPELLLRLSWALGLTAFQFRLLLGAIVGFTLLVPFFRSAQALFPQLVRGFHAMAERAAPLVRAPMPTRRQAALLTMAAAALLLFPPMALGNLAGPAPPPDADAGTIAATGVRLLVHYRPDWYNLNGHPEVSGGNWDRSAYTPQTGFYSVGAHKAHEDLQLLRLADMDALLVRYAPAYESGAMSVVQTAAQLRVPHAIEIDLADLANPSGNIPLTPATVDRARGLFDGPGVGFWNQGYHLRLSHDGPRVVFLQGTTHLRPSFEREEHKFVALYFTADENRALVRFLPSGAAVWEGGPRNADELSRQTLHGLLWRQAYDRARAQWWHDALRIDATSEREAPFQIVLSALEPDPLPPGLPARVVATYTPVGAVDLPTSTIRHVAARPDPGDPFPARWREAATADRILLVAWNDFDLGYGLEPTLEGGADNIAWLIAERGASPLPVLGSPTARR